MVFGGAAFKKLEGLNVGIRVALKREFAAFDSLVVCEFFRQTETP